MGYGETKRPSGRPPKNGVALGSSDRHTAITAERSKVDRVPCADPERRARLEADDAEWLKWYFPDDFSLPFEKPHKAIIAAARDAMTNAHDAIVVCERGIGKSSLMYGMVMKYSMSGEQPFPVYLPYSQKDQDQGIRFWKEALCDNERLAADYPEICAPFVHAGDVAQRLVTTTWRDTGERTGARTLTSMGRAVIVFPDGRGLIGTSSMGGNPRGMHYKPKGKPSIRPTMAFIDDLQTDETAISPDAVQKAILRINGAIRGLKRAGGDFAIVIAGTCICSGDVMDHFLNHRRWNGVRIPCVEKWPDGWSDQQSEVRQLWEEWKEKYESDAGEVAFYRANRQAMTSGMVISSPRWYKQTMEKRSADKRKKGPPPVDAFHAVIREYYTMGHEAFMAERQQQPVNIEESATLVVHPEQVLARAIGPARGHAPEGALRIVAGADINPGIQSRLGPRVTWAVIAFARNQVGCVIAYGRERISMPADPTQAQSAGACFAALEQVRGKVGACGADVMFYDARGNWAPRGLALRYAMQRTPGTQIIPAEGWSNEYYRPTHKSAVRTFEGGHECADVVDGARVRWIAWNADQWGETALRSWLAVPGAPGSCIIHAGDHETEFATQVSMKRLIGKLSTSKGVRYDWADRVGDQDYGDAIGMCWAAAAWGGIGTGGVVEVRKKRACAVVVTRNVGRWGR